MNRVRVLYIVGSGRSGSTIIGNTLGQVDDFVHVGELLKIWRRGLLRNYQCSCGDSFNQCKFWSEIIANALGDMDRRRTKEMIRCQNMVHDQYYKLVLNNNSKTRLLKRVEPYTHTLQNLYQTIQRFYNANIIIDSSKSHRYAMLLSQLPQIDLYVLHLVRDSRGVAYSWLKTKKQPGATENRNMHRMKVRESASRWNKREFISRFVLPRFCKGYQTVRYEDFADNPIETTKKILNKIGTATDLSFFVKPNVIKLDMQHTFSGNPVRFNVDRLVKLERDDSWRIYLRKKDKILSTIITLPFLKIAGY